MRCVVNAAVRVAAVAAPTDAARAFHRALPGYAPTPVRRLDVPGAGWVGMKDESSRLGLPAFKVLGASWAVERTLREDPGVHTLVAASAGNHGRAVAHVARSRGLRAVIVLPRRSAPARRAAITDEGAAVVVVDGDYEAAVAHAAALGGEPGHSEVADVGASGPAHWVVDGYATLFAEAAEQSEFDVLLIPAGVGSLAAAAVRFGAARGVRVVAVEPETAACVAASLAAGEMNTIATPGTAMAGLDCAQVSPAAWPDLRDGLTGAVAVREAEMEAALRELDALGLAVGACGAAALAALRVLLDDPACAPLRTTLALGPSSRFLLVATEGITDPAAHARTLHA